MPGPEKPRRRKGSPSTSSKGMPRWMGGGGMDYGIPGVPLYGMKEAKTHVEDLKAAEDSFNTTRERFNDVAEDAAGVLGEDQDDLLMTEVIGPAMDAWEKETGQEMTAEQRAFVLRKYGLRAEARRVAPRVDEPLGDPTRDHRQQQLEILAVLSQQQKRAAKELPKKAKDKKSWEEHLAERHKATGDERTKQHDLEETAADIRHELLREAKEALAGEAETTRQLGSMVFPEAKYSGGGYKGGAERGGESIIDELRNSPAFAQLQEQAASLGDDPSAILRLLASRGKLYDPDEKHQPHRDVLLLAVIAEAETGDLAKMAVEVAKRLGRALYTLDEKEDRQKAINAMVGVNAATIGMINKLNAALDIQPGEKPETKVVADFVKDKKLVNARTAVETLSGARLGSFNQYAIDFRDDWSTYLSNLEEQQELLETADKKLGSARAASAEKFNPAQTLEWLQQSEEYAALEKLRNDETMALIRQALGLSENVELTEKHIDDFLKRYFLKNVTTNEDEGTRVKIQQEKGIDIADESKWPIGDILKALILDQPQLLANVHAFAERIKGEPITQETKNHWRNQLIKMVRVSFECSLGLIQAFASRGVSFPPSPDKMEALIEEIGFKMPSAKDSAPYLRQYAGLDLDDQKTYKFDVHLRDGTTVQETIREGFQYPHRDDHLKEFWEDMALTVDQIERARNTIKKYNRGEFEVDSGTLRDV